jgi:large subunit ribosomal protein L21
MYAIVSINGQQFKAEEGKKIFVHHIQNAESGQTLEFGDVLLIDNEGAIAVGTPNVEGAKVVCEVQTPLVKGDKVIVFHMKRRKDSRKRNGHRQQFTELTIKQVIA